MHIAMASDHAGRALKEEIKSLLNQLGHTVVDFGTNTDDPADLPDHVLPASLAVASGEAERGIFVDGVGYGSAMIANKVPGIFCRCLPGLFLCRIGSLALRHQRALLGRQDHWFGNRTRDR